MKKLWFILVPLLAAVVWLAWRAADAGRQAAADSAPISWQGAPPTLTLNDAEEIFKKAFWRRPMPDDQILNAERREWSDEDGLQRWQWFIAVDPSDELARYLHEQNPFSLSEPKGKVTLPEDPRPSWFPSSTDGFTVRQSIDGQMLFLTQADTGRLFATSQGQGFAKPVEISPSQSPAARNSATAGRLPATPPPNPNQP